MSDPLVSIIIPLFNRAKLITETIDSLIKQTYDNWEAVIVDDGSTDGSIEIVSKISFKDNRVRLLKRNRLPKGAPTCRNMGVQNARGNFIIFLDSDDLLTPTAIEKRVNICKNYPDLDFVVFQGAFFIDSISNGLKRISKFNTTQRSEISFFLNFDAPWVIFMPIWKRESLIKHQMEWDEQVLIYQDIQFHVEALIKGMRYILVNQPPDSYWRRHDQGNIGKDVFKPDLFYSQIYLFSKFKQMLTEKGLFGTYERQAVKRLAKKLLFRYFFKRKFAEAFYILRQFRERDLLTNQQLRFLTIMVETLQFLESKGKVLGRTFYFIIYYSYFKSAIHYKKKLFMV